MQGGAQFLSAYCDRLKVAENAEFVRRHEEFVRALGKLDAGCFDQLDGHARSKWSAFFTAYQRRYLTLKEREAGDQLLATAGNHRVPVGVLLRTAFAKDAYERVSDLAGMLDGCRGRRVVMVGCGALPVTSFWLLDHYADLDCIGLDIDAASVARARELVRHQGLERWLRFEHTDGLSYDYADADFIYVANQVVPKRAALERIAVTAEGPLPVVVRDPYGHGWLLAEGVAEDLPAEFSLLQTGVPSPAFLSHDLLLSMGPRAAAR